MLRRPMLRPRSSFRDLAAILLRSHSKHLLDAASGKHIRSSRAFATISDVGIVSANELAIWLTLIMKVRHANTTQNMMW